MVYWLNISRYIFADSLQSFPTAPRTGLSSEDHVHNRIKHTHTLEERCKALSVFILPDMFLAAFDANDSLLLIYPWLSKPLQWGWENEIAKETGEGGMKVFHSISKKKLPWQRVRHRSNQPTIMSRLAHQRVHLHQRPILQHFMPWQTCHPEIII